MSLQFTTSQRFDNTRASGANIPTTVATAHSLWGLSPDQAQTELTDSNNRFTMEAVAVDVVRELFIKYRQQERLIDLMVRRSNDEKNNASFFNTYRLSLADSCKTLLSFEKLRSERGRDHCKPFEQTQQRLDNERRLQREYDNHHERERATGAFVDTATGRRIPGIDLPEELIAQRDVVRMRMLPKSPREDWLLAQMTGTLTEEEKKLDPNTLSDKEIETDLHRWNPLDYAAPGNNGRQLEYSAADIVFIERLRHQNEIWDRAFKTIDSKLEELGLHPRIVKPFVALPPLVQRAADGDPKASEELFKLMLNANQEQRFAEAGSVTDDARRAPAHVAARLDTEQQHPEMLEIQRSRTANRRPLSIADIPSIDVGLDNPPQRNDIPVSTILTNIATTLAAFLLPFLTCWLIATQITGFPSESRLAPGHSDRWATLATQMPTNTKPQASTNFVINNETSNTTLYATTTTFQQHLNTPTPTPIMRSMMTTTHPPPFFPTSKPFFNTT